MWVMQIYEKGFKEDKCSIRNKYEDGIPIDTYEVKGGSGKNNGGV